MGDLRQITSALIRAHDAAAKLRLADSYIQAFNRLPQQFVLPAEHAELKPIIEAFAYDTSAFAQYVRALRDGAEGLAYDELHDVYRMLSLRALQVERRARIRKAVLLLMPQLAAAGATLTTELQGKLSRLIEQQWGGMRLRAMASDRAELKSQRLTSEERAVVLDRFWRSLDLALERGEVPLDLSIEDVLAFIGD